MSYPSLTSVPEPSAGQRAYAGGIHNHYGISYGLGSLEAAYANARRYHEAAFVRLRLLWGQV